MVSMRRASMILIKNKKCLCGKQFPQQTHENNFQYIVNIEDLLAIINKHISSEMYIQSMESPLKKMMSLLPRFIRKSYEQPESICTDSNCTIKHTTMKISIQSPLPNVICLNLNYHNPEFDPLSLLKIFLSIPDTLKIQDLFDTQEKETPSKNNGKWLLFDDTRVKEIIDWASLVNDCVQALIKPTTLFFQKVPDMMKSKLEVQANEKFNPTKLEMLNYDLLTIEKKARQQSEAMFGMDHAQQIEMMRYYQLQQQQFQSEVGESNSSFQPESMNSGRSEQSNPGNQPANDAQIKRDIKKCMKYLKEEYLKIGVYLFKCESCQQYMHLNQLFCPYKGCKVRNSFHDETKVVDKDTNYSIMQSIFEVHANDDKRKEILAKIACKNDPEVTLETQTPSEEVSNVQNKIDQVTPSQVKQEAPKKEFKEDNGSNQENQALNKTIVEKLADQNYKLEFNQGFPGSSPNREKGSMVSQSVQNFSDFKVKPIDQKYNETLNKYKNLKKNIRNGDSYNTDKNIEPVQIDDKKDDESNNNPVESELKNQNVTQSMTVKQFGKQNRIKGLNDNLNFNKMSQNTMAGNLCQGNQQEESPKIKQTPSKIEPINIQQESQEYYNINNYLLKQQQKMDNILSSQTKPSFDQQEDIPQRNTIVPGGNKFERMNRNGGDQAEASENEEQSDEEVVQTADVRASLQIAQLNKQEQEIQQMSDQKKLNDSINDREEQHQSLDSLENHQSEQEESVQNNITASVFEYQPKANLSQLNQMDCEKEETQLKQEDIHIEQDENGEDCIAYDKLEEDINQEEEIPSENKNFLQKNLECRNSDMATSKTPQTPYQEQSNQITPRDGNKKEKQKQVFKKENIKVVEHKKEIFDNVRIFGYGLVDLEATNIPQINKLTAIAMKLHDSEPKPILQQIIGEIAKGINPVPYFHLLDNILMQVQGKYIELIKPQLVEIIQNFHDRRISEENSQVFILIKNWENILRFDMMVNIFEIFDQDFNTYYDTKQKQKRNNQEDTFELFYPLYLPLSVLLEDNYILGEKVDRTAFKEQYLKQMKEQQEEEEKRKEVQRAQQQNQQEEESKNYVFIDKHSSKNNDKLDEVKIDDTSFQIALDEQVDQDELLKIIEDDNNIQRRKPNNEQHQFQQDQRSNLQERNEQKGIKVYSMKQNQVFDEQQNQQNNKNVYGYNIESMPKWRCPYCRHINRGKQLCFGKLNGEPCQFHLFESDLAVEFLDEEEKIEDKFNKNKKFQQESQRILDNQQQPESDEHIGKNTQELEYGITSNKEKSNRGAQQQPIYSALIQQADEKSKLKVIRRSNQVDQQPSSSPKNNKEYSKILDYKPAQVSDNLWHCDSCGQTNIFDLTDLSTCICKQSNCLFKNKIIYEMICISMQERKGTFNKAMRSMIFKNYKYNCLKCEKWTFDIFKRKCKNCQFTLDQNQVDNRFAEMQFCKNCDVYGKFKYQDFCDICKNHINQTSKSEQVAIKDNYIYGVNSELPRQGNFNQEDNRAVSKSFSTFGVSFMASDYSSMNQFNNINNQRQSNNQANSYQPLRSAIPEEAFNKEDPYQSSQRNMKVIMHELNEQQYPQTQKIHQEFVVQGANVATNSYLKKVYIRCYKCGFDFEQNEDHQCRAKTGSQQQRGKSKSSNTKQQLKCRKCFKYLKADNFNEKAQGYFCTHCRIITKFDS